MNDFKFKGSPEYQEKMQKLDRRMSVQLKIAKTFTYVLAAILIPTLIIGFWSKFG